MKFASAISTFGSGKEALRNAVVVVQDELGEAAVHFAVVFATAHYEDDFEGFATYLGRTWPEALILGCTACGVIGEEREIEGGAAALTLLAGNMPGVDLQGFRVDQETLDSADDNGTFLRRIGLRPVDDPNIVLLGDPFSIHVNPLLERLGEVFGECPIIGGMASGGERPGQNALMMNGEVYREGVVGVVLSGNIRIGSVVSQGCRPIGSSFVITKADRNVILELGGKPALEMLRAMFTTLPPEDRSLAESDLFIGIVVDEYKNGFGRGDFLIRNLVGWDPKSGAVAIADNVRVGTTVQFHVRDAGSADEDLRDRLLRHRESGSKPCSALLFSCNGRGTRMWDHPHHDISCLRELVGEVPTGGFFCAGELGPIGGKNFIHGHTASIALISPRE